jgi:hypothetical protein
LIEPLEARVEEMWNAAPAGTANVSAGGDSRSTKGSGFISLDDAPPELRAMMEDTAKQHWESWFDLAIPALNDMTPREAAQTDEGRELLESLLLFYECNQADSSENVLRPDISALRRDLGME